MGRGLLRCRGDRPGPAHPDATRSRCGHGRVPRLGRGQRAHDVPAPGGSPPGDRRRVPRHRRHAHRVRQEPDRGRRPLRRPGRSAPQLLHRTHQGPRVGEVLRPVGHVRGRQRRHAHRRRLGQPRCPDHLLHRGDPRQPRPARGPRRRRRPGRHGRVPLLRRPRPRLGVAGPAARTARRTVHPDVRHARRRDPVHRDAPRAHRPARRRGPLGHPPHPTRPRVPDDAAHRGARGAAVHAPGPRVRRALHPGIRGRAGAVADERQPAHPTREGRDRRAHRRVPLRPRVRQDARQVRAPRHRRPPRGDAAQVPAPGGAAGPGRAAQGHLRDRHPRRRHQRAHPHRGLHRPRQVRRHVDPPPQRAGVPPDRRPRRAGRLRHDGHRHRPRPRPRHREPQGGREGGGEDRAGQEGPQDPEEEAAARARCRGVSPRSTAWWPRRPNRSHPPSR